VVETEQDGALPLVLQSAGGSAAPRLQPLAPWVQGLMSLLRVPQHVKSGATTEAQNITAAMSLTVALATAAGAGGSLPPQLLSIVSSFRSHMEEIRPLGKGGFGSVTLAHSRLDGRPMAVKKVCESGWVVTPAALFS
jgi:hypothetical protein